VNIFPFLAAFTTCVSLASISASLDTLREPISPIEAHEGFADRTLTGAGADPVQARLDRALTPPTDYFPPAE
jgi:hypothetical protein